MEYILVSLVALIASLLTLFSGFGLGTLLMPVTAIFFPLEIAISMTAVVHVANNLFKVALLGKYANRSVLFKFGLPAMCLAFIGALLLTNLSTSTTMISYALGTVELSVTPIKFIIGSLILMFVLLELIPQFTSLSFEKKYLPLGGMISGFLGGLSGHQGAFRTMFLLKMGLSKQEFIATGVMIAVMVDVARLSIYGWQLTLSEQHLNWTLVTSATLSAFIGAYVGKKMLPKITILAVQRLVSALLVLISLGLITDLI